MVKTECTTCSAPSIGFDLVSDFVTERDTLVYHDAPLEGWMRCRACNRRFVFECSEIIPGLLWHWVMVPWDGDESPYVAIRSLASEPPRRWLSVVEDRRCRSVSHFAPAWLDGEVARPFPIDRPVRGRDGRTDQD